MDTYFFQIKADGSKTLFRVLKDGTNRAVSESYHGYLTFVAAGNIAEIKPYIAPPPSTVYIPVETIIHRLGDSANEIWQSLTVAQQIRFIRLQNGIAIDDAEVRALLAAHEIDPDEILKQEI